MEPPPLPSSLQYNTANSTTKTAAEAVAMPAVHSRAATSYPDDAVHSTLSRTTASWDNPSPLPAIASANSTTSSKLRLICSYGGRIFPRPRGKSLDYIGGETRIVAVDRNITFSSLASRLSQTLLNGRPFTVKYLLPSEGFDSLISVTTDEDLENMIEEYDRIISSSSSSLNSKSKPFRRLRIFLFPSKLESNQSMGSILENASQNEVWFVNALNGDELLSGGFSDSTLVNRLLGLNDHVDTGGDDDGDRGKLEKTDLQQQNILKDVHSVSDSAMPENMLSFASASSDPSLLITPRIGVLVKDQTVDIDDQFARVNVNGGAAQKQWQQQREEVKEFAAISSSPPPPPIPKTIVVPYVVSSTPQLHPQNPPNQAQDKLNGASDMLLPDSVSSGCNIFIPLPSQKPLAHQDPYPEVPSLSARVFDHPVDPKINIPDPSTRVQFQNFNNMSQPKYEKQETQSQPQEEQQFIHFTPHYGYHQYPIYYMPMPVYTQMRNGPAAKPEMASGGGVYIMSAAVNSPRSVQMSMNQHMQNQCVGKASGRYELVDPSRARVYYAQPLAPETQNQTVAVSSRQLLSGKMK